MEQRTSTAEVSKRQLPQPIRSFMINTVVQEKESVFEISPQERRPNDLLQEDSIVILTDSSELTSFDGPSIHGAQKRRRLDPAGKIRNVHHENGSDPKIQSLLVRDDDYQILRLQLVDSVAKAMQLDFQNLPLPNQQQNGLNSILNGNTTRNAQEEQLMLSRTFFRAYHNGEHREDSLAAYDGKGYLKPIKHEYYLAVPSSSESVSQFGHQSADETLSTSSSVVSAADHAQQLQQHAQHYQQQKPLSLFHNLEEVKDQSGDSIGSILIIRQPVPLSGARLAEFMQNLQVQTSAYLQARRLASNNEKYQINNGSAASGYNSSCCKSPSDQNTF